MGALPACPGRKQIASLAAHYFQKPAPLPEAIGVPVTSVATNPLSWKRDSAGGGGLRHHTPTDMLFAQLFAFADAAREGRVAPMQIIELHAAGTPPRFLFPPKLGEREAGGAPSSMQLERGGVAGIWRGAGGAAGIWGFAVGFFSRAGR